MDKHPPPTRLLVFILVSRVSREQQAIVAYLKEEDTVLREQMGGRRIRQLILDRAPLCATVCRRMLNDSGVTPGRPPVRSPNLNAHAKRFVLPIQSECTDRMAWLGQRHLCWALTE